MLTQRIIVAAAIVLAARTARAEEPTISKLGIVFHLKPHQPDKKEWTWTPQVRLKIKGPIASSATVSVSYTLPGGKPWLEVPCENVSATAAGEYLTINDCGYRLEDNRATNQTGVFGFAVKVSDGLSGGSKTLHAGKFSVGRQLYNPERLPDRNRQFYYYVDNDWRLPIGMVGTWFGDLANTLYAEVWLKQPIADLSKVNGYLFFNGKQVAEADVGFTLAATPPEIKPWHYQLVQIKLRAIVEKPPSDSMDSWWKLYEHPGTYEIKLLRDGALARTLKVTIGPDGKPVDGGAAASIGVTGALVPVTVLGTGDGSWRKDAYKTEALFGNPIAGFTGP